MDIYSEVTPLHLELLKRGILDISDEIRRKTVLMVRGSILFLDSIGSPNIEVRISSPGGDVFSGHVIYDLIRLYKGSSTGVVYMGAFSAASVILQACTLRKCTRHSTIVIHHISRNSVSLDVMRDPTRRDRLLADMEKIQAQSYAIIASRMNRPIEEISRICAEDRELSAEEALELGLIDEII